MSDDPILAALARMEAGLDALADRMDRLQAGQERQGAVLDRTAAKLDGIHDDITVNMEAASWSKRSGDMARDDVRALGNVVEAMQRQIRRLQARLDGPAT